MHSQESQTRKVNQLVGKSPSIGWLPASQLPFWVASILFSATLWLFLDLSLDTFLFWAFLPCIVFWGLTGNKPHRFLEKFHAPRHWVRGKPYCQWSNRHPLPLKPKVGQRTIVRRTPMKIQIFHPIEDAFHLVCYGEIRRPSRCCGFYLLTDKQQRQFRVIFAWSTDGIDPNLKEQAASEIILAHGAAFKELPPDVTVRVEYSSFADDAFYQHVLDRQLEKSPLALTDLLLYSQKKRVRELRDAGKRLQKRIHIFATYSMDGQELTHDRHDWLGKLMGGVSSLLETFKGEKEQAEAARLEKMVSRAYNEGFKRVDSILNTIMNLGAHPIPAQSLYESDYRELHKELPPPIPQLLILDDRGLRCQTNSDLHVTAVLVQPERGASAVPQSSRAWIYFPTKKKYGGFMQLGKPKAFSSPRGQLRYLFELSARNHLYDFKIVTEISVANQGLQKWDLERHTRNANSLSLRALTDQTVDVSSEMRGQESIEARQAMERGEMVVASSTGVWLYRNNPAALEQDFNYLANCLSTADSERAIEVTEHFWLQSLPFSWERLLRSPYDRRDYMFSHEVSGMLPLVAPRTGDESGISFLSREGGSPVWIDLFDQLMHLAIFATTRGGKSVLLAQIVFEFYLRRIPVVLFDFPRPTDGSSTFSDLTNLLRQLGGSAFYYDIGSCSNNLIQMPSFRGLPNADQRREAMIDFQIDAIVIIVMGSVRDSLLEESVRSLVEQSFRDFHARPDIISRYAEAMEADLGTAAYENVPTLWDYLDHLKPWLAKHLQEDEQVTSDKIREASAMLLEQLRGCLHGRLGRACARPSSFPDDPELFVFALRNLSTNREAAVAALAAYSALLRRALESPASAFIIDESPILFDFPPIARIVGQLCANGLKWGCRVILSAQTAEKIYKSAAGEQIVKTIDTKMVGYILPEAVDSLVNYLDFDREIVSPYATASFKPSKKDLRSNWVSKRGDTYIEVGFFPSEVLLALVANNPDEQAARNRVMAMYDDPIEGLAVFARLYAAALRNGTPMDEIEPETVPSRPKLRVLPSIN